MSIVERDWCAHADGRISLSVPSIFSQTILNKALLEHGSFVTIARVCAASSSIRNSSLAANAISVIQLISHDAAKFAQVVFPPSDVPTVQFTHTLDLDGSISGPRQYLIDLKNNTKYFTKSLRTLQVRASDANVIATDVFSGAAFTSLVNLRLQTFSFNGGSVDEFVGLLNDKNILPELRDLKIHFNEDVTETEINTFISTIDPIVTSLAVTSTAAATATGLQSIGRFSDTLVGLTLSSQGQLTADDDFRALTLQFPNLEFLDMCNGVADRSMMEKYLSKLTNLVELRLGGLSIRKEWNDDDEEEEAEERSADEDSVDKDDGFIILGKSLQKLTTLHLDYSDDLRDRHLEGISYMKNLTFLNLRMCPTITGEGLCHIGERCSKLEVLLLTECYGVTDNGILKILNGCPQLRKIDMESCQEITDAVVDTFIEKFSRFTSPLQGGWIDCYGTGFSSAEEKKLKSSLPNVRIL